MTNYIFDFDGTLADSLQAMVEIFNQIAPPKYKRLDPASVATYRAMSSRQVLKHVDMPLWRAASLVRKGLRAFRSSVPNLNTFAGIPEVLAALQKSGSKLYVVTSNEQAAVEEFLQRQHLTQYFSGVYCGASLFGKWRYIQKVVVSQKLDPKATCYVGDETRDIEAARRVKIPVVSVTWGFNVESVLKAHHPDFLIHQPKELLTIAAQKAN